ncbi:sugar ABC transporter substrate-binding protein [Nocardioides marinquilinus]|uniref:Sugar ABC transporter substrate-binding protein n=1 Tax=Nocardioides marinquilinus TaxID=1210400 RepID=A0ABP9PJC1_9ACTN
MTRRLRRAVGCALGLVLALGPLAACDEQPDPEPEPSGDVTLSFGVFGDDTEVAAYQEAVDEFNEQAAQVQVQLLSWPDAAAFRADLETGARPPDIYLVARRDLQFVIDNELNEPLFELLEARDLSLGDEYSQRAIEGFSADDDLQCMPYSVSPMVIYYNKRLVDFDLMRERGLPAPEDELEGWTFEEFAAAATFASRPRTGARGLSISPTLRSLAPFIYSGGGQLFDDPTDPTSLAFSSDTNIDTLTTIQTLLRDPEVTLSEEQLAEATPLQWFQRGRLGMIEGYRGITPQLRKVASLSFDVMPMPRVGGDATIGDLTGLCISPGDHVQPAADFLVNAISPEGMAPVAEAGYIVPTNLAVARSDAFLQPGRSPSNAGVFNAAVESIQLAPLIDDPDALNAAVEPELRELLTGSVIPDLSALAAEIDERSRAVLDPDYEPSPEPTD